MASSEEGTVASNLETFAATGIDGLLATKIGRLPTIAKALCDSYFTQAERLVIAEQEIEEINKVVKEAVLGRVAGLQSAEDYCHTIFGSDPAPGTLIEMITCLGEIEQNLHRRIQVMLSTMRSKCFQPDFDFDETFSAKDLAEMMLKLDLCLDILEKFRMMLVQSMAKMAALMARVIESADAARGEQS